MGIGLAAVVVIGALIAGVFVAQSDRNEADGSTGSADESTAVPFDKAPSEESEGEAPQPDAPNLVIPSKPKTFQGSSSWTMKTSRDWVKFDIPQLEEEAAWATGGGSANFGNNINVLVEAQQLDLDLPAYTKLNVQNLEKLLGAKVKRSNVYSAKNHDYARVEYLMTYGKQKAHNVAYIAEAGDHWVVATFTATRDSFASEAPEVEPYLATLQTASNQGSSGQ